MIFSISKARFGCKFFRNEWVLVVGGRWVCLWMLFVCFFVFGECICIKNLFRIYIELFIN